MWYKCNKIKYNIAHWKVEKSKKQNKIKIDLGQEAKKYDVIKF